MPPYNIVKARKVGNSIVLTAPQESAEKYYTFSIDERERIIYTPLRINKNADETARKLLKEYQNEKDL